MAEYIFVYLPVIGGVAIGIISVIMDAKQKQSNKKEEVEIKQIISSTESSLDEVVRMVLAMQMQHQKKDKWVERIIGFLMGLASSLVASFVIYFLSK